MNTETWIIFGLLAVMVVLFLSDRIRLDLVALLALLVLVLTPILTPAEALASFGDPILLTIAGLFVVGAGLLQTGVADAVGQRLRLIAGNTERRVIVVTMVLVALFSAVMSSTGTVAIFLPVVVSLAAGIGLSRALHLDGAGLPEDELGESGIDCRNVTALFTQFISNTATAVLMAPIVTGGHRSRRFAPAHAGCRGYCGLDRLYDSNRVARQHARPGAGWLHSREEV